MKQEKIVDSYLDVFEHASKVLVFMAHPDDAEIICGGLIARLCADHKAVRLVVGTDGEKGIKNDATISVAAFRESRRNEVIAGAKVLGIPENEVFLLGYDDGMLPNTVEVIEKLAFHIRQFQPDIIIGHNPSDIIISFDPETTWVNHRDHRHAGLVTVDAIYPYSRDRGFFPEHFADPTVHFHEAHTFLFSDAFSDSRKRYFDITNFVNVKRKALDQHNSAIPKDEIDGLIEENETKDGYFEPLGLLNLY